MKPEVLKIILSMMCLEWYFKDSKDFKHRHPFETLQKKKNKIKTEHDEPENTADCSIKVMNFNPSGSCSFENNSSVYYWSFAFQLL